MEMCHSIRTRDSDIVHNKYPEITVKQMVLRVETLAYEAEIMQKAKTEVKVNGSRKQKC